MYSKVVFIGESKKGIESLHERLSLVCNFPCKLGSYLDYNVIIVNNELDYKAALIIGNLFANNGSYDVKWVNEYGLAMPINEFCICKITPKSSAKHVKAEVEYFISNMSEKINMPLTYKYNVEQKYEIYIKLSDILSDARGCSVDYNYILTIAGLKLDYIKSFVDSYLNNRDSEKYFDRIEVIDFDGKVVPTKLQKEFKRLEELSKYFENSALCMGLYFPGGNNIAPKKTSYDISLFDNNDYYLCDYDYGVNSFEYSIDNKKAIIDAYLNSLYEIIPNDIKNDKEESNKISLTTKCQILYKEYYRVNRNKLRLDPEPKIFKVEDSLNISTSIEITNDKKLVVTSNANVKRKVENERRSNCITIIDKMFGVHDYTDNEFSFTSTDYYEIIDLNLLLHYTEASKYYEIYRIPIGFKFEDGLDSVISTRIIYDKNNPERIAYDDISKVIEHLKNNQ